ncbi:MAG: hypothetical protein Q9M13_07305 [Mariprofundales bacterium]|nr:hypothetical protein [Mariprofundales bacterium]
MRRSVLVACVVLALAVNAEAFGLALLTQRVEAERNNTPVALGVSMFLSESRNTPGVHISLRHIVSEVYDGFIVIILESPDFIILPARELAYALAPLPDLAEILEDAFKPVRRVLFLVRNAGEPLPRGMASVRAGVVVWR